MVRLREIQRTATFAWSTGTGKPLLVTGTRAGAVDDNFSVESKLELWDLDLDNGELGQELQPIASISIESRFYGLAWGAADEDHPAGIIAGAQESGSLTLWDAEKLLSGASDAIIAQSTKHTGAIKDLQFNPSRPNVLATAGTKGELYVHDINDLSSAFRLGTAAARSDDLECVAWNQKVPHILATGGAGGFVMVWDLKTKKASWTLNNHRKPVSSVAWDPQNSTKLLVSTSDDNDPSILLWDLRNSTASEKSLRGHEQGVLSLSWCTQDSEILLSCGKDNRTIVWNPLTGEQYGEFAQVTNWTFLTRFNPHNPNICATASFDGKIVIQTLQNTNSASAQNGVENNLDGEDFFKSAQTQPSGPSFSLSKAPSWLRRPVGASFGFGGKLVTFKPAGAQGKKTVSNVEISQFSVDSEIGSATEAFEKALNEGDLSGLCKSKLEEAKTEEEKNDWIVMQKLVSGNPRASIVEFLGFEQNEKANGSLDETSSDADADADATADKTESDKKSKRMSDFFGKSADDDEDGDFLTDSKGAAAAEGPFHLINDADSAVEQDITKAIMLGNFAKATDICLKEKRMADAFLVANCGGPELVEKVQTAYLSQVTESPSYIRLLASVTSKNLWDVVNNASLDGWKEVMAFLCTFSEPTDFPEFCEILGDRVLELGSKKDASFCYLAGGKLEKVVAIWIDELQDAEKTDVQESTGSSSFSVHARHLQQFIEKVSIFRKVTKFQDNELGQSSGWKLASLYDKYTEYADIVAAHGQLNVAQKYLDLLPKEFPAAEVARNRVRLAVQKPGAGGQRINNNKTAVPASSSAAAASVAARASSRTTPVAYQTPQPISAVSTNSANPYGPTPIQTSAASANPYGPPAPPPYTTVSSAYQPQGNTPYGGYQPPATSVPTGGYGAPNIYGGAPNAYGSPNSFASREPSKPPPPPAAAVKNMQNWNDVPVVARAPPRKSTPSVAPITSPFLNQNSGSLPPPQSPNFGQRPGHTPPPPPPKAGAPRISSPPQSFQGPPTQSFPGPPSRPSSTTANVYAPPPPPPPQAGGAIPSPMPQVMPRTASPYNAPPAAAPPTNRYAPAPAAQQPTPSMPPTGASRMPPPPNPYGPPQGSFAGPPQGNNFAQPPPPPPQSSSFSAPPPPQGPPRSNQFSAPPPPQASGHAPPGFGSAPVTATPPPPQSTGAAAAPPPPPAAAAQKYPPGDRSHIPAEAQRLVEVLERDFQRVASKAPASFAQKVKDTQKRIGLLFDHLNNGDLVQPETVQQLTELCEALEAKDYTTAQNIQMAIQTEKTDECGTWMVGVKRLISMSKSTP